MAEAIRYNLVTFTADAVDTKALGLSPDHALLAGVPASPRLFLTLEGPWVMSAGLKPNLNRAIVPCHQFDLLGGVVDRTGKIDFWYTNRPPDLDEEGFNPGQPVRADVTIENVRIVDVEHSKIGQLAGDRRLRIVEY